MDMLGEIWYGIRGYFSNFFLVQVSLRLVWVGDVEYLSLRGGSEGWLYVDTESEREISQDSLTCSGFVWIGVRGLFFFSFYRDAD